MTRVVHMETEETHWNQMTLADWLGDEGSFTSEYKLPSGYYKLNPTFISQIEHCWIFCRDNFRMTALDILAILFSGSVKDG